MLDTSVLAAAVRSRRGASFRLLSLLGTGRFELALSVPLVLEYESTLGRMLDDSPLGRDDVDALLDYLCSIADLQTVFFLWRPHLRDPKDDMVLELAVASRCDAIVTFNRRDFAGSEQFGIEIWTPAQFLHHLGDDR